VASFPSLGSHVSLVPGGARAAKVGWARALVRRRGAWRARAARGGEARGEARPELPLSVVPVETDRPARLLPLRRALRGPRGQAHRPELAQGRRFAAPRHLDRVALEYLPGLRRREAARARWSERRAERGSVCALVRLVKIRRRTGKRVQ